MALPGERSAALTRVAAVREDPDARLALMREHTQAGAGDAPYVLMSDGADELDSSMEFPQGLARFNRRVTKPIQRMWAGWLPPFAIVEHVGRRSGKPYRTPVNVFSTNVDGKPGVAILLTYGPDRDWLKNLTTAGGGQMRHKGRASASPTRTSSPRPRRHHT